MDFSASLCLCGVRKSCLQLRLGRRQITRYAGIGETDPVMAAITERLVGGLAAAAEGNYCPAPKSKQLTGGITDFKIPFDAERAVMEGSHFG